MVITVIASLGSQAFRSRLRTRFIVPFSFSLLALVALPSPGRSQTILYTWADLQNAWSNSSSWTTTSGNGTPTGSSDIAQFSGGAYFDAVNALLTADTKITQLRFSGGPTNGWTLTGAFVLTIGTPTDAGIVVSGGLNYTIDVASLILTGPNTTAAGSMIIGSGSLTLTGGMIASAGVVTVRSGTLILDNSARNPAVGQRLTTSGAVNLFGGGSALEFRGANTGVGTGTTFSGFSGSTLNAAGGGDTFVRTIQQPGESLAITFSTLGRSSSGTLLFENIGAGYVGDAGKPTVTFNIAPFLNPNGSIITGATGKSLPWAAVTQRAATSATITGRWANYSGGVVASSPNTYPADDFSTAATDSNILFKPTSAGTVTVATPPSSIASLVLEPAVPGVTLNLGSGLNTFGVMLSGGNDISVLAVNGNTNFLGSTGSTRTILVLSSTAALTTNASFNISSSSTSTTIGGNGFVILTGTSPQLTSSSFTVAGTTSLNLAGGVLRGTPSNLVFTGAGTNTGVRLQFRGGVLEYDVSTASATFALALGTASVNIYNQVNWTGNAGIAASNNVGGGGFSAYSTTLTTPGNTLTVNLGGASGPLFWNDSAATNAQLFITDGYALKFGSLRSNSTVIWLNPIFLDGNSDGTGTNTIPTNRVREVNVTRGVGNAADKTLMAGPIRGSATTDFLKTGTGVLVLTGNNDYHGNTFVNGGELQVSGVNSGTGMVVIRSGGTLAGNGQVFGNVSLLAGGTIRGGDGTAAGQTLTTGAIVLDTNTTLAAVVAGSASIDYSTAGASLIASTSSFGRAGNSGTIHIHLVSDGTLLPLDGTTHYTRKLVSYTGTGSALNPLNGIYDVQTHDFTVDGTNFAVGSDWQVTASASELDVIFTASTITPEPVYIVMIAGLALGLSRRIRPGMRRLKV